MSERGINAGCGMQMVARADLASRPDERPRWRCILACGHSVHRRQDKPPQQACCERRAREAAPPTMHEAKARRAMLAALAEQEPQSSAVLVAEVLSATCTRKVCLAAIKRLEADGAIAGNPKRWSLTDAGRAELATKRAA